VLREYLIGTGGWAYFRVPGLNPLVAYSRKFNFVEVNSTFYSMPHHKMVERWRRVVPNDFKFSVRAHKSITHVNKLRANNEVFDSFELMKQVCQILDAEVLHLQTPGSFEPNNVEAENLKQLLSTLNLGGLRLALELRGMQSQGLPPEFSKVMRDHNLIHCVDLSKGEMPCYDADILYTRLFGMGHHNVYQPSDAELKEIDRKVSGSKSEKVAMSFHFVKMYKDAARLKVYKQTGKFPMVTCSTGIASLEEVINEEATFPATKEDLIIKEGWKLFDKTETERARVSDYLEKVPQGRYENIAELVDRLASAAR
jgi:uncharacterized protein YecE (DUF72 family)